MHGHLIWKLFKLSPSQLAPGYPFMNSSSLANAVLPEMKFLSMAFFFDRECRALWILFHSGATSENILDVRADLNTPTSRVN